MDVAYAVVTQRSDSGPWGTQKGLQKRIFAAGHLSVRGSLRDAGKPPGLSMCEERA